MVGINRETVSLSQANGPDVELVVTGTELYATYGTRDGYPVVYDEALGLFCFAHLIDGEYKSTGVPLTEQPPADVERHVQESAAVRSRKIAERQSQLAERSRASPRQNAPPPKE